MNPYSQFMTKEDLVFDIGANVGDRTAIFAGLARRVLAVEPQQQCADSIRKRFESQLDTVLVIVIKAAVGAAPGRAILKRTKGMTTTASMSSRFMKDVQQSGRFGDRWGAEEEVRVTTLDNLIALYGEPAFIKIDVEGFEPEVIRGLSQAVKALSFEFHPEILYMAKEVLDHALSLGSLETNYAIGNYFTKLELTSWVQPDILLKELEKFQGDNSIMGDIYIRWKTM